MTAHAPFRSTTMWPLSVCFRKSFAETSETGHETEQYSVQLLLCVLTITSDEEKNRSDSTTTFESTNTTRPITTLKGLWRTVIERFEKDRQPSLHQ